jgi:hypothetical protein
MVKAAHWTVPVKQKQNDSLGTVISNLVWLPFLKAELEVFHWMNFADNMNFVLKGKVGVVWKCYTSPLCPRTFILYFVFLSSSLFFLIIALVWQRFCQELCTMTLKDESKSKSSFQQPVHLSLILLCKIGVLGYVCIFCKTKKYFLRLVLYHAQ